jgi:hypothetical protein
VVGLITVLFFFLDIYMLLNSPFLLKKMLLAATGHHDGCHVILGKDKASERFFHFIKDK